jgi:glycine/D-amino acid oxidase-like deaminating enzyme/nitrite reductase/ring-hydroxylating ferredoxin subunit
LLLADPAERKEAAMQSDSGTTTSIWMLGLPIPAQRPLEEDLQTEVCVVGAGMAGMTTAYLLAREGRDVVVVDDGPIGGGETCRTTAHLTNVVDDRYQHLERLHGERGAILAAQSHTRAIDTIAEIAQLERIDCEFERVNAYLFVPPGDPDDILERELIAARRAGVTEVEMVERAPIEHFHTGRALRFTRQAQFHPIKYLTGLADTIERRSGRIFARTRVNAVEEENGSVRLTTEAGPVIRAGAAVVATNSPIHHRVKIHTKQAAYRTYVIAGRVPRGSVTRALYYDTPWPYHYVRLQALPADHAGDISELLMVGGEDHKTGQEDDAEDRFGRLESWTRERFPMMDEVMFRWSGQVLEPVDAVAFIGRDPEGSNVYLATGDSGMGMTHATIAGLLITDLIAGRHNRWVALYDPGRVSLRAAGEFARENLNVAAQYLDHATGGDVDSSDAIAPGEGAVLRHGLHKIAAYRSSDGALHTFSAVCPHLGCVVAWNSTERTWDCPCHGSRFDAYGRVINGPAVTGLEAVAQEVEEPRER